MTLAELVVASAIFAMILLAVAAAERAMQMSQDNQSVHSDTYRAAMLCLEHVKTELRGARVVDLTSDHLNYKVPRLDPQGMLVDSGISEPSWDPPDPGCLQMLVIPGGDLVSQNGASLVRTLGHLGGGGITFAFARPDRSDLVQVAVRAVLTSRRGEEVEYDASLKLYLHNQP